MTYSNRSLRLIAPLCVALVMLLLPDTVHAQRVALGVQAGSMGGGPALHINLTPKLNARVGGNFFSYSQVQEFDEDDVTLEADADVNLGNFSGLIDFYPVGNTFHLTGGIFYNGNDASIVAYPITPYEFDENKTFQPERIGTLTGEVQWEQNISPYVGLGFGNAFKRRVTLSFDLGVLYTGAPTVNLEGTGLIAPTAEQDDIITEGLQSFEWWPYLSFGINLSLF